MNKKETQSQAYVSPAARRVDMQAEQYFLAGSTLHVLTRKKEMRHDEKDDADEFDAEFEDSLRTDFWY